jgi:hypothetical protein
MDFTNFFVTEKDNGNPNLISLPNINEKKCIYLPNFSHSFSPKNKENDYYGKIIDVNNDRFNTETFNNIQKYPS